MKATKIGIVYFVTSLFEKAIGFFLLPVFTNLLSTEDYGIYNTYIAYVGIASIVMTLSLGNSLRSAINDYKDDINGYIASIVTLEALVSIAVSAIALPVSYLFIPDEYRILVVFCLIQSFLSSITSMYTLLYIFELKYIKRSVLIISSNLLTIGASIVLIKLMPEKAYMGRVLGCFLIQVVYGLFFICLILKRYKCNIKYWKYALKFSLPLIFHSLSLIILQKMDRTMLTSMKGASETGIYSVAYNFGTLAIAFTTVLENIWVPWFYKKMKNLEYTIMNSVSEIFSWTAVILSCGVIFLSPEVMTWLINKDYLAGIGSVPFLVGGTLFSALCVFPINLKYYMKKTRIIAISSISAALINLVLNYLLIPKYGSAGAAFTTMISYFVMLFMQVLSARKTDKNLFGFRTYVPQIITAVILIMSAYLLMDFPLIRWGITVIAAVAYLLYIWKNRKNLSEVNKM